MSHRSEPSPTVHSSGSTVVWLAAGQVLLALPRLGEMLVTLDTDGLMWQLVPLGCQADGLTDRQESMLGEKSTFCSVLCIYWNQFSQQVALLELCFNRELVNERIAN